MIVYIQETNYDQFDMYLPSNIQKYWTCKLHTVRAHELQRYWEVIDILDIAGRNHQTGLNNFPSFKWSAKTPVN